jgi:hypothetical protein
MVDPDKHLKFVEKNHLSLELLDLGDKTQHILLLFARQMLREQNKIESVQGLIDLNKKG